MTPERIVRWTVASAGSALLLFLMTVASATPVALRRAEGSRLRLSWSARPERIEVCRTLSAEELAKLEEHMRQRVQCNGRFATYTLRVESDGKLLHESVVRGSGLRHDRPLYLLRDLDVPPGVHHVRVDLARREKPDTSKANEGPVSTTRVDTGLFAGRAQREVTERARRAAAAIPARLALDTVINVLENHVIVVSLDQDHRVFRLLDRAQP
jgi:hypothetical protein